jgi:hypothetical protein
MGSVVASSGECVVSGLVQRLGALRFISGNVGCFGNKPFLRNGRFITFGAHEVYVGTERTRWYPEWVLVAADPSSHNLVRDQRSVRPMDSVEVMMTAPVVGTMDADVPPPMSEKQKRMACQPLEKPVNLTGMSNVSARPKPLHHVIARLPEPVVIGDDPARVQALLEEQRHALCDKAIAMQKARDDFNRD